MLLIKYTRERMFI